MLGFLFREILIEKHLLSAMRDDCLLVILGFKSSHIFIISGALPLEPENNTSKLKCKVTLLLRNVFMLRGKNTIGENNL